ncbi:hypothetical protein QBC38DRAFT_124764 [Podospora fimiseda]|uniref:Uncharacterized protein n=1 Tax=Podospora fimiseda TaxID=252190 RepID=A0AAN7BT75_9PEZI|nr:hypothetical protein QBC38DRAFT_124764 [Podospora fimiseda]
MAPHMTVERAQSCVAPVELEGKPIIRGYSKIHRSHSQSWGRRVSAEGLYQVCISEVLDNGLTYPLEHGGGRFFIVSAVLDLGLRMMESSRGQTALESLARKAICVWRERPVPGPVYESRKVDTVTAVDEFLHCVRQRFPVVKLDRRNGFLHEEETNRQFAYWSDATQDTQFNPKAAAVLHLNSELIDKLYWARLKADVARRHRREDDAMAHTQRFRRLQFHLAAMVTHHLCHLFVNFLREFDGLSREVTDADFMRLVTRYDPGAEFEIEFFGGRPKLFIDHSGGPEEEKHVGQSYVIKRGENDRRMAAVVATYKIDSYLQGDFSVPLLTEVEGEVFPMERYQDVKRRHGESKLTSCHYKEGTSKGVPVEIGSAQPEQPLGLPWDIKGPEYQLLKKASFDPAVRVVNPMRVKTIM